MDTHKFIQKFHIKQIMQCKYLEMNKVNAFCKAGHFES